MRIVNRNIVWIEVPRCGTSTTIDILDKSGISCEEVQSHEPGDDFRCEYAMISVRHPVTWLRSLWEWSRIHGFDTRRAPMAELVRKYGAESLKSWSVWLQATTSRDGWVTDMGLYFTAQTRCEASLVHAERLREDLKMALVGAGVKETLADVRNQHVSGDLPDMPDWWVEMICDGNEEIYNKWGYSEVPQEWFDGEGCLPVSCENESSAKNTRS